MKIVKHVGPTCDCLNKVDQLAADMAARGHAPHLGSIVECDCGKQYKLVEHQIDGQLWTWFHPDSGDMSKR